MLKKGEQIIIINDPAQTPIKFYHRRTGSESAILSQLGGLQYPSNGTYEIAKSAVLPYPPLADNYTIPAPTFAATANADNWERMSINGYNTQIDALKVLRAFKYGTVAEVAHRAGIQISGTPLPVGSEIGIKIVLRSSDKYYAEFNTVFADGKIEINRTMTVTTATLAAISTQMANVINNPEMRLNGENPFMNLSADGSGSTTTALVSSVVTLTPIVGIDIESVTFTQPSTSAMVITYVPSKTALTGTLAGGLTANVAGTYGRGIYNIMRKDFPQTVNKIYPYADETTDGTNRPYVGATYTAYLISVKVQNASHAEYNATPVEYFDYWIYVNNSCTATLASIGSWLNTLNNATLTAGRKNTLAGSASVDIAAAYTAWVVPQRLVFGTPNAATGVESITTVAAIDVTGM